ncbi:hypothetical protein HNR46_000281 [Haloferula luteola]|uniref:Uncharacterized protein n=1 Tax=Haloferula luteola TaxID=595692 RepID=A0A840V7X6_9BACT|nr:hypothetical protein [Haloferula luteola]
MKNPERMANPSGESKKAVLVFSKTARGKEGGVKISRDVDAEAPEHSSFPAERGSARERE